MQQRTPKQKRISLERMVDEINSCILNYIEKLPHTYAEVHIKKNGPKANQINDFAIQCSRSKLEYSNKPVELLNVLLTEIMFIIEKSEHTSEQLNAKLSHYHYDRLFALLGKTIINLYAGELDEYKDNPLSQNLTKLDNITRMRLSKGYRLKVIDTSTDSYDDILTCLSSWEEVKIKAKIKLTQELYENIKWNKSKHVIKNLIEQGADINERLNKFAVISSEDGDGNIPETALKECKDSQYGLVNYLFEESPLPKTDFYTKLIEAKNIHGIHWLIHKEVPIRFSQIIKAIENNANSAIAVYLFIQKFDFNEIQHVIEKKGWHHEFIANISPFIKNLSTGIYQHKACGKLWQFISSQPLENRNNIKHFLKKYIATRAITNVNTENIFQCQSNPFYFFKENEIRTFIQSIKRQNNEAEVKNIFPRPILKILLKDIFIEEEIVNKNFMAALLQTELIGKVSELIKNAIENCQNQLENSQGSLLSKKTN